MYRTFSSRSRGFTLIEAMVALTVLAAAAALFWLYTANADRARSQESMVKLQAQQMAQLTRAMIEYGTANKASWTPGSFYEVSVASLISAGHLPTNFGTYGQVGVSPFGQNYRVKGGRSTTAPDTIMALATEFGTPTVASLKRAGVSNTAASIKAVKQQVAAMILKDASMAAGVMDPSTAVVQGNFNGFSFNISGWFAETMPASARVAVIKNIPPVDTPDSGSGGPTDPMGQYSACRLAVIGWNDTTEATCPSGYTEVAAWSNCGAFRGGAPIQSTPVGTITFGKNVETSPSWNEACRTQCTVGPRTSCTTGQCYLLNNQVMNERHFEQHWINSAYLSDTQCRIDTWLINSSGTHYKATTNATAHNNKLCCLPR
jgi:prepilin-type N-terminal cleavage/methylation domain-containing protein